LGLVVLRGVKGELAQESSGAGVDDADVEVVDEHDDVGSGVGSAGADVLEPAGVAQGDDAAGVDAVVADTVVAVGVAAAGGAGLRAVAVGGGGGRSVWEGAVRAAVVVLVGEGVEQGLQLGQGGGLGGLGAEPLFEGLLEPFDFAAGARVVRSSARC